MSAEEKNNILTYFLYKLIKRLCRTKISKKKMLLKHMNKPIFTFPFPVEVLKQIYGHINYPLSSPHIQLLNNEMLFNKISMK